MARRPTVQQIIDEMLGRHQPIVYQSFIEAIVELRSGVSMKALVERLERGDIGAALDALNIDADAFSRVELTIMDAYNGGGQATVQSLPRLMDPDGQPIIYRWGVRNLPAEQGMREHAANLVRGITVDARDGIREVLIDGLSRGQNPTETARDVVGRRNRSNNTRTGGYLGLTRQQMQTVATYRRAMETGDIDGMRAYLNLQLRDKRFDRSVAKAIREGRPLQAQIVQKATTQYAERALDYRGRVLSRHETMTALSKSRDDAYQQQIDAGKLAAQDVTMTWRKTPRENPRLQHIAMDGQTVAFGQSFTAPDGTQLRYPLDPQAPARHTIGCMCRAEYSVDFTAAALRRYQARTAV